MSGTSAPAVYKRVVENAPQAEGGQDRSRTMEDDVRMGLLRGCGGSIQFVGGLCLVGVVAALALTAAGETRVGIIFPTLSPLGGILLVTAIVLVSSTAIVLGHHIKRGSLAAARWATILCWVVFGSCTLRVIAAGEGWEAVCFSALLVLDGHIATSCAKRARAP